MRKRIALLLMLTLLAAPTLAAAPAVEEGPATWISDLVDQVVEYVLGLRFSASEQENGPAGDPNGTTLSADLLPEGENGPGMDPNGTTLSTDSPPEGDNGPWIDPNG